MSEEIIKVLNDLASRFGVAIDWTNQNIVPYLQDLMTRFIKLQNASAIIWIIFSAIILIISMIFLYKFIKTVIKHSKENKYYDYGIFDDDFGLSMGIFLFGFIAIMSLILLMSNIFGIFQNIYTPELTVIEYIKNININS